MRFHGVSPVCPLSFPSFFAAFRHRLGADHRRAQESGRDQYFPEKLLQLTPRNRFLSAIGRRILHARAKAHGRCAIPQEMFMRLFDVSIAALAAALLASPALAQVPKTPSGHPDL